MNILTTEKRTRVVSALVEGNSIRSTCRMIGVGKNTVARLLTNLGAACQRHHDEHVRGLEPNRLQCDEIWAFVYAKEKNLPTPLKGRDDVGSVWTWTAIDADSKLIVAYHVGTRNLDCATQFMLDIAGRVTTRCQLTTDAHGAYLPAVLESFGNHVDYAQLVKVYREPRESEARYSPCECVGVKSKALIGLPDHRYVSTSYVERNNLTMRMGMRRFTRLTNGFSKKLANHKHAVAIHFMHYNFCRKHQTLGMTPAEYCQLSDHRWTIEDLVDLMD